MVDNFENGNNIEGTPNTIGELDEVGLDMLKEQVLALESEEKAYIDNLEEAKKTYDNYNAQWEVDKRLHELQLENHGLDPSKYSHKVHFIPEFWELQKKKYEYVVREDTFRAEQFLSKQLDLIAEGRKQLEIVQKNLADVRKQLEEADEQ